MGEGKKGGRLAGLFTSDPDRDTFSQVMTTVVTLGGVLAAAGAAMLMIGLATDLLSDSSGALGDSADPLGGRFFVTDAHVVTTAQGNGTLHQFIALGLGAEPVNVTAITLEWRLDERVLLLVAASEPGNGTFQAASVRDRDGSMAPPDPLMDRNDLVELRVSLQVNGIELGGGETIHQIQHAPGREPTQPTVFVVPSSVQAPSLVSLKVID